MVWRARIREAWLWSLGAWVQSAVSRRRRAGVVVIGCWLVVRRGRSRGVINVLAAVSYVLASLPASLHVDFCIFQSLQSLGFVIIVPGNIVFTRFSLYVHSSEMCSEVMMASIDSVSISWDQAAKSFSSVFQGI